LPAHSKLSCHVGDDWLLSLLSGKYDHLLPKDKHGRIFLDLDLRWIASTFNLIRDMAMWDGDEKTRPELSHSTPQLNPIHFKQIEAYFRNDQHDSVGINPSEILNGVVPFSTLTDMLPDGTNKTDEITLLYRGSRDGYKSDDFHSKCDDKKKVFVIVRDTDGNVFGAYTSVGFSSVFDVWIFDESIFLFSIKQDNKIEPRKCDKTKRVKSSIITSSDEFLFGFGSGHDLAVSASFGEGNGGRSQSYIQPSAFDPINLNYSQEVDNYFDVDEVEVFQLSQYDNVKSEPHRKKRQKVEEKTYTTTPECHKITALLSSLSTAIDVLVSSIDSLKSNSLVTELSSTLQYSLIWYKSVHAFCSQLIEVETSLTSEVAVCRDELTFVAKYVGIPLPDSLSATGGDSIACVLSEIEAILAQLMMSTADSPHPQTSSSSSSSAASDASSIVTISAGGTLVAVSRATLLQAPSGSMLANMASDVWGHDLDSDGHIVQDVNPELFVAIVNYLRLRALGVHGASIVVYEDQRAAMCNLLAFYAMSEAPLEVLKNCSSCHN
jgi:hypothetical protein